MSEVKWIKLHAQMFDDEKIRLIEKMPEADTILIIWVKLLTQAGRTNASGYIYLSEKIPYTDEMLATIFNRPLPVVRLALATFKQFGMIDIENDFIRISNWEKHQNIDGLDRIREQNRLRKQKERKKKQLGKGVSRDGHIPVTQGHATEEEREEELESDKEQEKEKELISAGGAYRTFEEEGFGTISSIIAEKIEYLIADYSEAWVVEAMKISVINGKRSLSYVEGILKRWKSDGIDTKSKAVKKDGSDQGANDAYAGYDFDKELPPNF